MKNSFFFLFLLVSLLFSGATSNSESSKSIFRSEDRIFVEFEESLSQPEGWSLENKPVHPHTLISLVWALKQNNLDQLENIFWDVSNPNSKNYGKYLSLDEIAAIVAPRDEDISHVQNFLDSYSPVSTHLTLSRDFIVSKVTVQTAEEILNVKFSSFYHHSSGNRLLRSLDPYTLPTSVASKVDFVGGVHRFPAPRTLTSQKSHDQKRWSSPRVIPSLIREWYNISYIASSSQNSMATSQFLQQYYSPSDLSLFLQTNHLPNYQVSKIVGFNNESKPGMEASLDIEFLMGVAQNVTTWFYSTSGNDNGRQEPFLEWIVALNDDPNTPLINSISYGDEENTISGDYMDRCNVEFQKFGISGHSLLFASGDSGVGCYKRSTSFKPEWPTQSPYVTAVGGTYLDLSLNKEIGISFSGGGFSNYYTQPSYQRDAVAHFFSTSQHLPPSSFYNSTSRAYPDISAFAYQFQVIKNGRLSSVGGTSASTPTVSATFALLNDVRLNAGKSPLGFLNPFLYQTLASSPEAFNDITDGNNAQLSCPGFQAIAGWDPVTGVGSPNFAVLKQVVLQN